MLNVIKVKLLLERTSGVPPIIFCIIVHLSVVYSAGKVVFVLVCECIAIFILGPVLCTGWRTPDAGIEAFSFVTKQFRAFCFTHWECQGVCLQNIQCTMAHKTSSVCIFTFVCYCTSVFNCISVSFCFLMYWDRQGVCERNIQCHTWWTPGHKHFLSYVFSFSFMFVFVFLHVVSCCVCIHISSLIFFFLRYLHAKILMTM